MMTFQPTRPLRGATISGGRSTQRSPEFQPTRPLRGATLSSVPYPCDGWISTHAPLAGRDGGTQAGDIAVNISTHAPLAGRDGSVRPYRPVTFLFQPTRPLRGATAPGNADPQGLKISTHAPLAGRDLLISERQRGENISTHAPLAGRDR